MINPDTVLRNDEELVSPKGKLLKLDAADAVKKMPNGKPTLATARVESLDALFEFKEWKKADRVVAPFNGSDDFLTIKDVEDNVELPKADKIEVDDDSKVLILELKSDFDQLLLYHFRRGFKLVEKDKSFVAVIIDMNTPGGRVDVLKEIAAFINACDVPVILYVEDMAISAGAILSFATDEIYMKDGSHIGAAAPVLIGGGGVQEVPESYKEKLMSFIRSSARALAQKNGYREEVAEAMIDAEVEVKIGDIMICPTGKLLTLTAREAVKIMPDGKPLHGHGIVPSLEDVLKLKGLDKIAQDRRITLKTTASEKIARLITTISPLLFILGIICFYVEARTPGFGVFGITALISFGLIFFGHHIAQAAGFEGVFIFLLGVFLLLLELFVIPGFGIAGVSGILCMLTGFVWIMIPHLPGKTAEFNNPWGEFGVDDLNMALIRMCISIVLGGVAFWLMAKLFPKTPIFNKLVHVGATSSDAGFDGTDEKKNKPLEGKVGVAKSVLRPSGIAIIDGKRIDVVTQGAYIEAGTKIRVKEVQGVRIVVVPVKDVE
jgi:membrane-bound serine protease (ClpP class)